MKQFISTILLSTLIMSCSTSKVKRSSVKFLEKTYLSIATNNKANNNNLRELVKQAKKSQTIKNKMLLLLPNVGQVTDNVVTNSGSLIEILKNYGKADTPKDATKIKSLLLKSIRIQKSAKKRRSIINKIQDKWTKI